MFLSVYNITKSYKSNLALNSFTITLCPGIYALLGPNGSGKSTLMNIITDNLKADSGEITYTSDEGITENILKMGVRFREKLGFMPQYPGLYPNFTVERFMWYMAQAVLGDPEILILDEPTAGLDPKQRIAIRNYISKIAFNKIVIIATHVVSDIEFIARDIIMLKKGVIVDNAPPHELTKKIEGKVWNVPCLESEVQSMQDTFRVTNIARDDESGNVSLRVLSDEKPSEDSKIVTPTLEDYYLYIFGDTITV